MKGGNVLTITVGEGGKGGRGVEGQHGGKGADGWLRVEIRRIGLRARLRYFSLGLWGKVSEWLTWQKAGVIGTIISVLISAIAIAVTCT